jgi:hypothetical protein
MAGSIKIKIALAINPEGEWIAYGYKEMIGWDDAMDSFEPLDMECRFFIEAEVPLPDAIAGTIQGEVVPA